MPERKEKTRLIQLYKVSRKVARAFLCAFTPLREISLT
jgi:hypothetical protein